MNKKSAKKKSRKARKQKEDKLRHAQGGLVSSLSSLGCIVRQMNNNDRLQVLHNFFRAGEEGHFRFDIDECKRLGHDFRDYVAPDTIAFEKDHIKIDDRVAKSMGMIQFPQKLDDKLIATLLQQAPYVVISIDVVPVESEDDKQYGSHYQCFRSADSGKKKCLQTINADYLKAVVMEQIRNLLRTMGEAKEIVKAAQRDVNGKTELGGIQTKIRHLQYRINENSKISATLYENYASGILDGEYKELKEHYTIEKQRLQKELATLQNRQREIEQTIARFDELLEQYTAYVGDENLDERLIAELIERIDVSAGGNLEIHFTCDDIYAKILELTEAR